MKYLFYCLFTPPVEDLPTPEIDPYEWHAHSWREPKALRLERKEKNFLVGVGSMVAAEKRVVVHPRVHWSSMDLVLQE